MLAWPLPANRKLVVAAAFFAAALILTTTQHGARRTALHPSHHISGPGHGSGSDAGELWYEQAAPLPDGGNAPSDDSQPVQPQQQAPPQEEPQQVADNEAVISKGRRTPLPPAQQPRPYAAAWWRAMHDEFKAEVKAADEGPGFDLIFFGDSLIEMWRGTRGNKPFAPRAALPGIFHDHFQQRWRAAACGMSGDTVAGLHWRLLHGELPVKRQPRFVIVLIGTNDLKDAKLARDASPAARNRVTAEDAIAEAAPAVAQGIGRILGLIRRKLPQSRIVVMALLPRHKADQRAPREWPNLYTKGLEIVNRGLQRYANQHSDAVTYLDCGALFFAAPDLLSSELLPDALHPSPKGADLLANCMLSVIQQLE